MLFKYFAVSFAFYFLLSTVNGRTVEGSNNEIDLEARRARISDCNCEKPNKNIICKKNQKKEKYISDGECKCEKYRCIWEVCPEVKDVQCSKCQVKIEVNDCGCKQFECQDAKKHCGLVYKPVKCTPCERLVKTEDECGCPQDSCEPLPPPPSQCPCKECEECREIPTGPPECGQKEKVCVPKECPIQKEKVCNLECETPEIITSKCGCVTMHCVSKALQSKKVKECDKCHVAELNFSEQCGFQKWECARKACEEPSPAVCYAPDDKKDDCGCQTFKKQKCSMVPAGDCPKGTVAQGGFDICGCPHEICVPCQQVYPDKTKCPHKCEKLVKRPVAEGQCEQVVCEPTADCNCPQIETPKCKVCETVKHVKLSENCVVPTCAPSDIPKCVCRDLLPKSNKCGKCQVAKKSDSGPCKGVKTCVPMAVSDCPKVVKPKCLPCHIAVVVTDDCGCTKYECKISPLVSPSLKCGDCEVTAHANSTDSCPIPVCVPSDAPECICKEEIAKSNSCGKCQIAKKSASGPCAGVKTCSPMSLSDCPKSAEAKCPPCQIAKVVKDGCGCPKYQCEKQPCAPLSKMLIKCDDTGKSGSKKVAAVGKDVCGCPVQTCVEYECEAPTTLAPTTVAPTGFPQDFGQLVFRNDEKNGVNSLDAIKGLGQNMPNVATGPGFQDLRKSQTKAWIDRSFLSQWKGKFATEFKKVRFMFWKRSAGTVTPVVDIIFNGAGSDSTNWFAISKIIQVVTGPDVRKIPAGDGNGGRFWSAEGQNSLGRHFYVNKSWNGCGNDHGMLLVVDKSEVCFQYFHGNDVKAFPRFLYAGENKICNWADANCVKEADVFTISVMQ